MLPRPQRHPAMLCAANGTNIKCYGKARKTLMIGNKTKTKITTKIIVAKALEGQRYLWGEQSSGPKGVDDLCFHTYGEFSPPSPSSSPSSYPPLPPASRPISQPQGPYPSLEAQIPVLRPKSLETGIWALGLEFGPWPLRVRFGPQEGGIWASRLGYGPPG